MTWSSEHRRQLEGAALVAARAGETHGTALADLLYRDWYALPVGDLEPLDPWAAPITGQLRAAHANARTWSEPTRVIATGVAGTVVIEPRRALCRGEYATAAGVPGRVPRRGDVVTALGRRGGQVVEGWWRTWGSEWGGESSISAGATRFYFATVTAEVARLVHAVTAALASGLDHWALKVGVHPETLARADGAVLYVRDADAAAVAELVTRAARPFVRSGVPPLTAPLVPGISWAQDPGDGRSHGEVRCALLSAAWDQWREGDGEFADLAAEVFGQSGFDPAHPELRPVGAVTS